VRYENLNIRGLKLPYNKKMVKWFHLIDYVNQVFKGCIWGKHHRDSFPVENSLIETKPFELLQADVWSHENLVTQQK
jgi:hypothetical protein